eukprot:3586015-Amphidinium_carterae.1
MVRISIAVEGKVDPTLMIQYLWAANASINATAPDGTAVTTPLHIAAGRGVLAVAVTLCHLKVVAHVAQQSFLQFNVPRAAQPSVVLVMGFAYNLLLMRHFEDALVVNVTLLLSMFVPDDLHIRGNAGRCRDCRPP